MHFHYSQISNNIILYVLNKILNNLIIDFFGLNKMAINLHLFFSNEAFFYQISTFHIYYMKF